MHVSFGRQALGSRRELHLVRPFDDDPLARLEPALDANLIAIARRELEIPSRESFAAQMHEYA